MRDAKIVLIYKTLHHAFFIFMSSEKIRILLTNDDGYHSEGIIALENALLEIGDVYVVAPASEMSGASHSLTLQDRCGFGRLMRGIGRLTERRPIALRLR